MNQSLKKLNVSRFIIINVLISKVVIDLTLSSGILWQRLMTLRVPKTLNSMEVLSASSNLTVAAEWKTIETSLTRVWMSCSEIPSSGMDMSP